IQTAEALMSRTGFYTSKRQIFVDSNIAEYLGNQKGKIDLTPETYKYASQLENLPPLRTGETLDEFKERVMAHIEMLQILPAEDTYSGDRVVWIITHGFVISTIYDILKEADFLTSGEETFYPSELEGIVVRMDAEDRRVSTIKITEREDGSTGIKIPFLKGK
ncbi:MAG TPA: histidine phosphatase family protein, partial [Bacteroidales bacterium]|nr:histidine phosphatase family protein [Bacteroidales bacterium]